MSKENKPLIAIIMGSKSDWETMRYAADTLKLLAVPHTVEVVSAHRTPDKLFEFAGNAELQGIEVIIAGAGGSAHLPGMTAAKTSLPVLGVPVQSKALNGMARWNPSWNHGHRPGRSCQCRIVGSKHSR
jgi:5-(carboxyamino)imidazole ribonucleotide mutase